MIPNFLKPYHTNLSNLIRLGRKSDGGYVIDRRIINKTRTVITCGLETEWSFEEVQSSNMSKLGEDGKPIYNESGKVMKGPKYFKPDLTKFLN